MELCCHEDHSIKWLQKAFDQFIEKRPASVVLATLNKSKKFQRVLKNQSSVKVSKSEKPAKAQLKIENFLSKAVQVEQKISGSED